MSINEEELLYAVAETGVIDPSHLRVVWAALNHQIDLRLIQHHKPVEFNSFTVSPCPYRGNWENHLLTMFPSLGPELRAVSVKERWATADRLGILEEMANSVMLACKRGTVYWTLRIQPNRRWWRRMIRAEQVRKKALGPVGYLNLISNEVYRLRSYFLNYVYSWLGETSLPCAAARHSPLDGGRILADYVPVSKMARRDWEVRPRGGVVRRNRVLGYRGPEGHRSPPPSVLRAVPIIRKAKKDLRDGGTG